MFSNWLRKSFPKVANKKVVRRARTMLPQFVPLEDRVNPVTLFGLTDANQILTFDSATPGTINSTVTITGLQAGELITGIDTRPATGQLFGMGLVDDGATRTARIYTINASTGAATPVGGAPFTTAYPDRIFGGFNFNPNVDLIRIISREGPNFRVSPNTGALVATDTNTSQTGLNGVSYTNNDGFVSTTTLYGLNFGSDELVTIGGLNGTPSPNTGQVFTVGSTGVIALDAYAMEISSSNGSDTAYATADSKLFTVNLTTGATTLLGAIGGSPTLLGLTAAIDYINVAGTAGDDTLIVNATGPGSGSYSLNGGPAVAFSGIKSFTFNGRTGADAIEVILPAVGSNAILEDDGTVANGLSRLRSAGGTFATITFTNPASLSIMRGNAADTLITAALPDFTGELTIGTDADPFVSVTLGGDVTLAAGKSLSVFATDTLTVSGVVSSGGTVGLNTLNFVNSAKAQVQASGNVTIVAVNADLQSTSAISAGGAVTFFVAAAVDVGGADNTVTPVLGLTNAELNTITAAQIAVRVQGPGAISITSAINLTGTQNLHLESGAGITQTAGSTLTVDNLALQAAGAVVLTEQNDVNQLGATVTGAGIQFQDADDLTIFGFLANITGISAAGNVTVTAGSFSVNEPVLATGGSTVTLSAANDLTVNPGVNVAGDAGTELRVGQANAGGVLTLSGASLTGTAPTTILGGDGADTFNVNESSTVSKTSISAKSGNDTIRLANGVSLNGGTIDGGTETDTIDYSQFTTGVSVNLGLGTTGLTSNLNGLQENPPIASAASGTFNVTYDIVTRQATVTGTINNLTNTITDAHIHRAGVGVNGPVIVGIGAAALVPTGTPGQFTINVVLNIPAAEEAAFLGGQTYFNVHSNIFPGGEIRGQIFSNGNVNLPNGTATGTGGISGVENVIGGNGKDSLVGSFAANILNGLGGDDTIVGGPGSDTFLGGSGKDVLVWSNGDGSDVMDGQADSDTVAVNGNLTANDVFVMGANGSRLNFQRTSPGPFSLDIGTTETVVVNGIGGDDSFTVNDTTGVLGLTRIDLNGFAGNDAFNVTPSPIALVNVTGHEQTTGDSLSVNGAGLTLTNTANTGVTANAGFYTASGKAQVNFSMIESGVSQISIDNAAIVEGTGGSTNLVFTVRLSAPSSQTVSVNYSLTDGSAVSFEDFANAAGTVTFAPGETVQTITVAINPDNVDENDELFAVNLDSPVNATILDGAAVGTIQDDDDAPAISVGDSTITEGTGGTSDITFTVSLSNPSAFPVTVDFATGNGSAIDFDDYTALAGTVTFAPGETTKTITISVLGDVLDENDEDFSVTLSNPVNGTIADGDAIGLIVDDDLPPIVSISNPTITEGNAGTQTLTFTVSLDAPSGRTVAVDFETVDASALAGSDFVAQAGTLTFAAGVTSQTIVVTVNGDVVVEGNEAFAVELSNAVNATLLNVVGTGSILNDDSATISIATGTGSVEGVNRVFTVTLSNPVDVPVSVLFATVDGSAIAGTTGDYLAIANSLVTFTPGGALSQTVTVAINDDMRLEGDETFSGSIGALNAAGRDVTLTIANASAGITDNESATVSFAKATSSVLEAATTVTIPVMLTLNTVGTVGTAGLDRDVTATLTRSGGTATPNVDFTMTSPVTVTFASGSNGTTWVDTKSVTGTIIEDLRTEVGGETIILDLATTSAATTVVSPSQHTLTINDDDLLPNTIRAATPGSTAEGTALRTISAGTGAIASSLVPFPGYFGSIEAASGDVTGDGVADLIVAAGPGGGPHVKVYDGSTSKVIRSFFAFSERFTGGVSLAAGDIDGDGFADIITGAGPGGGPHVRTFSGQTGVELSSFFAYDSSFRGGVNVAAGEMTGDNRADIVTGTGFGGGPHVKAFNGATGATFLSFFAYDSSFLGGVNVAVGDINGDGLADIVTGAGPGGGPHIKAFNGTNAATIANLFAYDPAFTGGVDVGVVDVTGDGKAEIVTGAGPGGAPHVKVFNGATLAQLLNVFSDDLSFRGGVNVG